MAERAASAPFGSLDAVLTQQLPMERANSQPLPSAATPTAPLGGGSANWGPNLAKGSLSVKGNTTELWRESGSVVSDVVNDRLGVQSLRDLAGGALFIPPERLKVTKIVGSGVFAGR